MLASYDTVESMCLVDILCLKFLFRMCWVSVFGGSWCCLEVIFGMCSIMDGITHVHLHIVFSHGWYSLLLVVHLGIVLSQSVWLIVLLRQFVTLINIPWSSSLECVESVYLADIVSLKLFIGMNGFNVCCRHSFLKISSVKCGAVAFGLTVSAQSSFRHVWIEYVWFSFSVWSSCVLWFCSFAQETSHGTWGYWMLLCLSVANVWIVFIFTFESSISMHDIVHGVYQSHVFFQFHSHRFHGLVVVLGFLRHRVWLDSRFVRSLTCVLTDRGMDMTVHVCKVCLVIKN